MSYTYAQTPGFNYQALILNNEPIQIPGTDVKENQVPLGLTEVTFRFAIENEFRTEYIEEQTVTTDENGMVSLIVGEGRPINTSFSDIIWDGKLKYLNVEINIHSSNNGFEFLDRQRILYIPHPASVGGGSGGVTVVNTLTDLTDTYTQGDLAWVQNDATNNVPVLYIYNGIEWIAVTNDLDPTNEFGLIAVADAAERDSLFSAAIVGDQVWNEACECIEVYNGAVWISVAPENTTVSNGLTLDGNNIKLGGDLIEPTFINTDLVNTLAITGLEDSTSLNDELLVLEENTGVLKKKSMSSLYERTEIVLNATEGQLLFPTPWTISNINKLDVYRNGVRISFRLINATTIEIELDARCYQGDQIRIVQLN
ncbi:hypothetical protein [Urechidicola vernalis]|uniref:Uncharacterized protein n=1 Tax=Urechidicola vernalis TaxID=3075600 RepID=A0ABU2YAK5_9FLAO|nr:hypothetical protein [Urechidicola sp. P050]MDT0554275.1 hypothetical protein [Urechidicola sp. P050]